MERRSKPTHREPVAHSAARRIRLLDDFCAQHRLPSHLRDLLRSTVDGRGATSGASAPGARRAAEREFQEATNRTVREVADDILAGVSTAAPAPCEPAGEGGAG